MIFIPLTKEFTAPLEKPMLVLLTGASDTLDNLLLMDGFQLLNSSGGRLGLMEQEL